MLWLLPEGFLPQCLAFWALFRQLVPNAPEARQLTHPPGFVNASGGPLDAPLRAGEIGLLSLQALSLDRAAGGGIVSSAAAPARLVVLTAAAIDLTACIAMGEHLLGSGEARLVGLLCGLPNGGSKAIAPICTALRVRHLILRSEQDADVLAISRSRRTASYAMPRELLDIFNQLTATTARDYQELVKQHHDLLQVPQLRSGLGRSPRSPRRRSLLLPPHGPHANHKSKPAVLQPCSPAARSLQP